jgi:hypothetical protein
MQKNNLIVLTIVLVVIAGAGGFAGGIKYQQSKLRTFTGGMMNGGGAVRMGQNGQGRMMGNRTGFRPVAGEILSIDDTSITVKMPDGGSKIVILSEKTTINKAATALKSDLKVGSQVAVFGQDNSDGSVTAQSIQLDPILRMGGTASPSASPRP